jgi:tetratricopeptide (TPR) repeat protein
LLALNRLAEAVEALDRYFASGGPPTATTYRVRGLAQTALGRLTQALEDFTLAIHLDPDPTTHAQRGWIYLGTDSPRLALADFEKAIQLDPSTADAYAGRGYARAVLGKYREAVADAEESLRRGPESPRLFWNAARIHARVMSRLEAAPARSSSGSLASHSQERGLQLLQKALDRVPRAEQPVFWKKYVQADASLASLRPTAGYRELEKVYARPAR